MGQKLHKMRVGLACDRGRCYDVAIVNEQAVYNISFDDTKWSLPAIFAKMAQIVLTYPRHRDEYFRGAGVGTSTYGKHNFSLSQLVNNFSLMKSNSLTGKTNLTRSPLKIWDRIIVE
jgi:hypothetical protein